MSDVKAAGGPRRWTLVGREHGWPPRVVDGPLGSPGLGVRFRVVDELAFDAVVRERDEARAALGRFADEIVGPPVSSAAVDEGGEEFGNRADYLVVLGALSAIRHVREFTPQWAIPDIVECARRALVDVGAELPQAHDANRSASASGGEGKCSPANAHKINKPRQKTNAESKEPASTWLAEDIERLQADIAMRPESEQARVLRGQLAYARAVQRRLKGGAE